MLDKKYWVFIESLMCDGDTPIEMIKFNYMFFDGKDNGMARALAWCYENSFPLYMHTSKMMAETEPGVFVFGIYHGIYYDERGLYVWMLSNDNEKQYPLKDCAFMIKDRYYKFDNYGCYKFIGEVDD